MANKQTVGVAVVMLTTDRVANNDNLIEEVNGPHLGMAQVCVRLEPDTDGLTQISIYIFQREVCHLKTHNHKGSQISKNTRRKSHRNTGTAATWINTAPHKSKVIITRKP